MCEWQSTANPNYRCPLPSEPGTRVCLLHKRDDKCVEEVQSLIDELLSTVSALRPHVDLTGTYFPFGIIARDSDKLEGFVWFPTHIPGNLVLDEIEVLGNLDLSGLHVAGMLKCGQARINGELSLRDARLEGGLFARGITVSGFSNLSGLCVESGTIDLREGLLEGGLYFDEASGWDLTLTGARIAEGASLARIKMKDIRAEGLELNGGGLVLLEAEIEGAVALSSITLQDGDLDLRKARISESLDLTHGEIDGILDLEGSWIGHALRLEDLTVNEELRVNHCSSGSLWLGGARPTIFLLTHNRRGIHIPRGAGEPRFWSFARTAFERQNERERADAAFYFERTSRLCLRSAWQAVTRKPGAPQRLKALGRAVWFSLAWLLDCIVLRGPSAYGASLARLVTTWAAMVIGFGAVYYLMFQQGFRLFLTESPGLRDAPFTWGRATYFSIVTLTTLGFGDIQPAAGIGSALAAIEALLGGVLIALTVVVLARKFMR